MSQNSQVQQQTVLSSMTYVVDSDSDSDLGMEGFEAEEEHVAINNASGEIRVVLTNPGILDCTICVNPLCSPMYECKHGHTACSSCFVATNNKCPSCCLNFFRCRAMEKVLESFRFECKNKIFGCKELLIYHEKSEHEKTCPHTDTTKCFCPLSSCNFSGSSKNLYTHFSKKHTTSATSFTYNKIFVLGVERTQKHIILQEQNEGVIFILNHDDIQGYGRVLNVDCIGPSAFENEFAYKITVEFRETRLSLECVPEVCRKWKEHTPNKNYLSIPSNFSEFLMQLCIKKGRPDF